MISTCDDGIQNGGESDRDCGGHLCERCSDALLCEVDQDCESDHCLGGRCATPTCFDLRLNQDEAEVDCGGICRPCITFDQSVPIDMMLELDMAIAGVEVELMKLEVLLRTAQEQALKPLSEQATDRLTTLEKLIKQFGQDRDLVFDLMFLNPNMIGYTGLNYQQLLAKVESLEAEVISCENLQVEQGPNSQY